MKQSLKQLKPLIGDWTFTGSFKNNNTKKVAGWESYKLSKDGKSIAENWEVFTIWPGKSEVNKGRMKIKYDTVNDKFLAYSEDGNDFEIRVINKSLLIKNDDYRFRGRFSADGNTIKGKWEQADKSGWKYWYDKILYKENKK